MVYLLSIIAIIFIDLKSKKLISKTMKVDEIKDTKISNLQIWHKKNYGFAYNVADKNPMLIKIITTVLTIGCYGLFFITLPIKGAILLKTGFSFLLGGASGNLIDRIKNNCVTDFIYIKGKHNPIFNIADVSILIGSLIVIIHSLKIKN